MTNAHVVAGTRGELNVELDGASRDGRVVHYDPSLDLAVLHVPGLDAQPMAWAAAAGRDRRRRDRRRLPARRPVHRHRGPRPRHRQRQGTRHLRVHDRRPRGLHAALEGPQRQLRRPAASTPTASCSASSSPRPSTTPTPGSPSPPPRPGRSPTPAPASPSRSAPATAPSFWPSPPLGRASGSPAARLPSSLVAALLASSSRCARESRPRLGRPGVTGGRRRPLAALGQPQFG